MNESILTSIKKLLGIDEICEHFDVDIIMHINSVFTILTQLGAGPTEGFRITGKDEVWSDFLGSNTNLEFVRSYVFSKVKLVFDPPLSSAVIESMNRYISELEWRIMVASDPVVPTEGKEEN